MLMGAFPRLYTGSTWDLLQLFMMIVICFILHPGSVGAPPSSSGNSQSLVSWEWTSQLALVVKNLPANAEGTRDSSLIPELRRFSGGEHGSPFQYFCLENPTERGAWRATVYRGAKSWTQLKRVSTHLAFSELGDI